VRIHLDTDLGGDTDDACAPPTCRAHPGLPDDLLNFQYDPVACAVAAGWPGRAVESAQRRPTSNA
jgi:hypothetical protein